MKKSRFTEEKIIAILKELEAGVKAAELARKHGVSEATLYNWRARYGGMELSQLRRLKDLESESARLKRMYADLSLTHQALQDAVDRLFIQPGRPMQNGLIERFNRTYRQEVLNCYVFETLGEVRRMTAEWINRYNEERPHEALGDLPPRRYLMAQSC